MSANFWTTRKAAIAGVIVAASGFLAAPSADATVVTFDFDGMAYRSYSSPGPNSAVQTYMRSVWTAAGLTGGSSLKVTGAGELSNNRYTGDGYVVGPATGSSVTPATLGSTEHGVQGNATVHPLATTGDNLDNYIVNNGSDRITIIFPTPIYSVSFDYEIFPDGTCPNGVNCGANWPDFKFVADGVQVFRTLATMPGTAGTYCESGISISKSGCEKAPQYLGVSGDWLFASGVTKLEFVDWPRRIGIDNLVVDPDRAIPRSEIPEPGTVALVGIALIGLAGFRRPGADAPARLRVY